jgi:hypothetical protein
MKHSSIFILVLAGISALCARDKSPVAGGFSMGTGYPWVFHLKPELILRVADKRPSVSAFVELNSVILLEEYSIGVSINFENRSGYMNSVYLGSGDAEFDELLGETDRVTKEYMAGWELKKEYGHDFGYFVNLGLEYFQDDDAAFPKADIGLFFLPGF